MYSPRKHRSTLSITDPLTKAVTLGSQKMTDCEAGSESSLGLPGLCDTLEFGLERSDLEMAFAFKAGLEFAGWFVKRKTIRGTDSSIRTWQWNYMPVIHSWQLCSQQITSGSNKDNVLCNVFTHFNIVSGDVRKCSYQEKTELCLKRKDMFS